jgi:RNA polymerase sigma-70 factor (ECF subfamily)
MVRRPMPFRIWLLRTAMQRLLKLRHHARAACRDVARETTMSVVEESRHDSGTILIPASAPSPSQQAAIGERAARLGQALRKLSPPDQAILELRTYQGLSYAEVADRLRIDPAAARKRFGRALLRLRVILIAEGFTESCL